MKFNHHSPMTFFFLILNHWCMGIITCKSLPGYSVPLQCLSARKTFKPKTQLFAILDGVLNLRTPFVWYWDHAITGKCVGSHSFTNSDREMKPKKVWSVSQPLQWSVWMEPQARQGIKDSWKITVIPNYHQSLNTVTILPHYPFQWKTKGPDKKKTMCS